MKTTLSWLKRHLETDASLNEITDALTRVGLEVESVSDRAAALRAFVSAHVVEARQHPNADRLRVCIVDAGSGPVQVVCGAPNARAGMKAVFAAAGTIIPATGIQLKAGTIRGEASNGMLVSEREMGLSGEHDGIIELPADAPIGVPFAELLGLNDALIECAVTPNRPDCLGVFGLARDLSASGIGSLKPTSIEPVPATFACPTKVRIEADDLCPAFALRLIRGVRNGPSPDWMQRWLRAVGLRPINALVDVTNFLTHDQNRPLHVFDAAKVSGDLVVRRAQGGETLAALDGRTYTLDDGICVIADDSGVESLAGIMGGEASGCSAKTRDVLVESALWNPLVIAQTGRKLGIFSDARFRFERGIDPAFAVPGLEMATRLILDLCGGEASQIVLAGAVPDTRRTIVFPVGEVKRLTGLDVGERQGVAILRSLGFTVENVVQLSDGSQTVDVTPPSWRPDIEGKADLVEEVMRMVGVDAVPSTPLARIGAVARPVLTPLQRRTRGAKRALAARGLLEAVTWSFLPKAHAVAFGGGSAALALANPIAADLSDMRPSLLPGLLAAADRNGKRGFKDVALFEVGQIFSGDRPDEQVMAAAVVRTGTAGFAGGGRDWHAPGAPVDLFEAKADILTVVAALGLPAGAVQIVAGGPSFLHPGRSGTLRLGANVLGWFGELHPGICEMFDLPRPVAVCELILDRLPQPKPKAARTKPALTLSDLQAVTRDFAFVVDERVASADLVRAAQSADKTLIGRAAVFDVYAGRGIEPGKTSIGIEVTLLPRERTLTDEEIEAVSAAIVASVGKATGAVLRS